MPEHLDIPLSSLNEWLNKQTSSIVEPLRADAKKLLTINKERLDDLLDSCDKLFEDAEKEMARGSRKTYRRAKALYKLAEKFASLIEEVTFPEEISGESLHQIHEQIEKNLKTIGKERARWFRAISPYFIISRRRFDVTLKRADDAFRDLTKFVEEDYVKAESAEGVSSKIEALRQFLTELETYESSKEARKQKMELLETEILQAQEEVQAIQTKDEVVELAQINKETEELTNAVNHELRHLQKPLLKFQSLISSPGYSLFPDAAQKLDEYLVNPFDALATENEGYPLLKSILQKMDIALDNDKVKLKPSRMRKAKDQISSILNKSALTTLHQKCIEASNKRNALSTSGAISEVRDERSKLQNRLKELQTQKKLLEARDARFEKDHEEADKRVAEQKSALEKVVSKLSDKRIQIVID